MIFSFKKMHVLVLCTRRFIIFTYFSAFLQWHPNVAATAFILSWSCRLTTWGHHSRLHLRHKASRRFLKMKTRLLSASAVIIWMGITLARGLQIGGSRKTASSTRGSVSFIKIIHSTRILKVTFISVWKTRLLKTCTKFISSTYYVECVTTLDLF